MTLTFKLGPDTVNVNYHVKYLSQKSFSSKVNVTLITVNAPLGPMQWSI